MAKGEGVGEAMAESRRGRRPSFWEESDSVGALRTSMEVGSGRSHGARGVEEGEPFSAEQELRTGVRDRARWDDSALGPFEGTSLLPAPPPASREHGIAPSDDESPPTRRRPVGPSFGGTTISETQPNAVAARVSRSREGRDLREDEAPQSSEGYDEVDCLVECEGEGTSEVRIRVYREGSPDGDKARRRKAPAEERVDVTGPWPMAPVAPVLGCELSVLEWLDTRDALGHRLAALRAWAERQDGGSLFSTRIRRAVGSMEDVLHSMDAMGNQASRVGGLARGWNVVLEGAARSLFGWIGFIVSEFEDLARESGQGEELWGTAGRSFVEHASILAAAAVLPSLGHVEGLPVVEAADGEGPRGLDIEVSWVRGAIARLERELRDGLHLGE